MSHSVVGSKRLSENEKEKLLFRKIKSEARKRRIESDCLCREDVRAAQETAAPLGTSSVYYGF